MRFIGCSRFWKNCFIRRSKITSWTSSSARTSARTHTLEVKPFTFVGATTRAGLISAPLRARFGIVLRLEFYTPEDLK